MFLLVPAARRSVLEMARADFSHVRTANLFNWDLGNHCTFWHQNSELEASTLYEWKT